MTFKFTSAEQLFPVSCAIRDFAYRNMTPVSAIDRERAYILAAQLRCLFVSQQGDMPLVGDIRNILNLSGLHWDLAIKVQHNMVAAYKATLEYCK